MTWSAEALDLLKSLVDAGLSAGQIATRMSISRSAVVGKIHRAGGALGKLARPAGFQRTKTVKVEKPAPAPKSVKPAPARLRVSAPPIAMVQPEPVVRRKAVDIIVVPMTFARASAESRCLFYAADPYSPASTEMLVCGCKRMINLRNKPYCTDHLFAETEKASAA